MKNIEIEKVEEVVNKIKIRFLGNFKDYVNGEVYEIEEEKALPFIYLGLAKIEK
jgi:hypothetical protein